ncbi:hypothetical protein AN478_12265 [Thiohalorhabdus denitrificans]|uniref:Uncharacterized membrane protein n=1 Tax=Thiohalorhabdus denitrificans TaxID=381306 RepID=A0A0N8PML7_9GAMM|nr:DUF1622 domain-containing protein [Thiohalorhabdus denitrificans]KPV39077.1 hypothetical protein AN478_12265 [Thiohalorhabdus denitrificans]SCX78244.1 Uncharacterized membrane protein [Thiohalorhabdus denitrificans]
MGFREVVNALVQILEGVGIAVILGGFLVATAVYLGRLRHWSSHQAYLEYRRRSVRGLILGLEFLVAADIIKTVAIDYTLNSVLMLAMIILIRTFLVLALHLEIEGRLPWDAVEQDGKGSRGGSGRG